MRWALLLAFVLTSPAAAAGLLTPDDPALPPLRITQHSVDIAIRDKVALTEITQTFRNDTRRRLEATYVFPLPEQAELTRFELSFNGKMVTGEVLPADKARRIYEDIVRRTKDPGLIEFIGRRLLRMRVFPIEPNSDTTIKMRYQQVTRPIGGMNGYHYPLRTSTTTGQAYGMVRFNATLESASPLKSIWSPSHAVEIVRDGEKKARVAYEASGGSLEEDFLLLFDTDDSDVGLSVVTYQPDPRKAGHLVLMVTPKQLWPKTEQQPQDVVFVIDTSGSMAKGGKIDQVREALAYCIEQLDDADRFDVVRFSTGFDDLFQGLVAGTRDNRAKAQAFAESFNAAGGTNIADTLTHVLRMAAGRAGDEAERPFVVVFLTDGQGNRTPDQIMKAVATTGVDAKSVRIFPFGVGHDVNTLLLDRLAGEHAGRTTYVQPGENLELVMGDFFSIVSQPVLTNLALKLPEIGATERFPATLGDLYHGQQLLVASQFRTPVTGPVTLTAMRNGKRVEYTWPDVSFASTADATYVPSVWAGRKIAYLIDQIREHGENPEMVTEVCTLSQTYGIQTPYTSWLVAPEGMPTQLVTGEQWRLGRARRGLQFDRLEREGVALRRQGRASDGPAGTGRGGGNIFGDPGDDETRAPGPPAAVQESVGKRATAIAGFNARLRAAQSLDGDQRLHRDMLAVRTIGDRTYNRIGHYLVDQEVDEKTEVLTVRFGTSAYFDLVTGRPDLRGILAASRHAMVMVGDGRAVLVVDDGGIEEFSQAQREQIGL